MKYFQEFVAYLSKYQLEQPVGCSELEIMDLERKYDAVLPEAYKAYLRLLGKDYKGVMVGTDCFAVDVESNNECVSELLRENNLSDYLLPEKYLAFFCHQGYMVAWFAMPNDSDDPIVTHYFEGTHEMPVEFGTFSDFMSKDLMGNARLRVADMKYKKEGKKWWAFWR